jgi:hypothetical protein
LRRPASMPLKTVESTSSTFCFVGSSLRSTSCYMLVR